VQIHSNNGWAQVATSMAIAAVLVSCATSVKRLNKVQLGMSRAQVEEILGEPHRVEAEAREQRLYYWLSESRVTEAMFGGLMRGLNLGKGKYLVTLVDDRCTSFKKVSRGT
jgi:outer membrane protein assembly factor BamE (lipoprotein component of BamABCDE complex)